jgi:hypothetical protein
MVANFVLTGSSNSRTTLVGAVVSFPFSAGVILTSAACADAGAGCEEGCPRAAR